MSNVALNISSLSYEPSSKTPLLGHIIKACPKEEYSVVFLPTVPGAIMYKSNHFAKAFSESTQRSVDLLETFREF